MNLHANDPAGFAFDTAVRPGGYLWWYADGISEDRRHAITVIAFVGSVFSPAYAAAKRRGRADPRQHCAINVAVYGADTRRWCFTEYTAASVDRTTNTFKMGKNRVRRTTEALEFFVDDCSPLGRKKIRGTIRLVLGTGSLIPVELDRQSRHLWWPVSPHTTIDVALEHPGLEFRGHGYHDANLGHDPLEDAFKRWSWSRTTTPEHTLVTYDCLVRGETQPIPRAWTFDGLHPPVSHDLERAPRRMPTTRWWLCPTTRLPGSADPIHKLEDTPFYARHQLSTDVSGHSCPTVYEFLDLDRFRRRWVQTLLWFRMRRARIPRPALAEKNVCSPI